MKWEWFSKEIYTRTDIPTTPVLPILEGWHRWGNCTRVPCRKYCGVFLFSLWYFRMKWESFLENKIYTRTEYTSTSDLPILEGWYRWGNCRRAACRKYYIILISLWSFRMKWELFLENKIYTRTVLSTTSVLPILEGWHRWGNCWRETCRKYYIFD